jgi:hypothetical protein
METGKWCAIFRAGKNKSRKGGEREWSEGDLDRIVTTYDPVNGHDAPICIDHDESAGFVPGGPAYGWVEALKREGKLLLAKFRKVVPEFAKAVNDGLLEKRSIGLYPDGTLRHVAWLGAKPPAVKGLPGFSFSESKPVKDPDCFDFAEAGDFKFEQQEGSVTEIEILQKKLADEQAARLAAEGKVTALETANTKFSLEFSEAEKKRKRQALTDFVTTGITAGKILPAWKDQGLVEFMANLEETTEVYEFSEGKKQAPLDWFKDFITGFASHPLFKTMTKGEATKGAQFSEDEKFVSMIVGPEQKGGK